MHYPGLRPLLLGLVLGAAVAASCQRRSGKVETKPGEVSTLKPRANPSLSPEQSAQVLARVGGRPITVGDYAAALERMDRFERLRYQSPERRKQLLDEIIAVELLADEAKRQGLDREMDTQLRLDQALRDEVLRDLRARAPTPEAIPDREVRDYYDGHREEFSEPERRRIAEIAVAREDEARRLLEAARKASAQEWGQLVRKYSIGRKDSAVPLELEGDLGIVSAPGQGSSSEPTVPQAVVQAAFAIEKVGDVHGEPVRVQNQFHIIRLTNRVAARQRTFAEAERSIRVKLVQARVEASQQQLIDELRKKIPDSVNESLLARIKSTSK
jgi:peptidyl-prolyl cis-trans isomerase C